MHYTQIPDFISQTKQIETHLMAGNSLSGIEALHLFRCRDLPKRISELRKSGYRIKGTWNTDAKGSRYMRYELDKSPEPEASFEFSERLLHSVGTKALKDVLKGRNPHALISSFVWHLDSARGHKYWDERERGLVPLSEEDRKWLKALLEAKLAHNATKTHAISSIHFVDAYFDKRAELVGLKGTFMQDGGIHADLLEKYPSLRNYKSGTFLTEDGASFYFLAVMVD